MTTKELYTCTECGEPCDPYTQEIHRHRDGMQHVTCPGSIAERVAQRFTAALKRLATELCQTISLPNWEFEQLDELPNWDDLTENMRKLTVAAMKEALAGELR